MTDQLSWRKANDWTLVGATPTGKDLYAVRRQLNYDAHPAVNYSYTPVCLADPDRVIDAGTYADSKFARQACQDDLNQQARQSVAASTPEVPQ